MIDEKEFKELKEAYESCSRSEDFGDDYDKFIRLCDKYLK